MCVCVCECFRLNSIFAGAGLTRTGSKVMMCGMFLGHYSSFRSRILTAPWVEQAFLSDDVTHSQTIGILHPTHHQQTNNRKSKCLRNWQAAVDEATALNLITWGGDEEPSWTLSPPVLIHIPACCLDRLLASLHIIFHAHLTSHFGTVHDRLQKQDRNS